MVASSSLAVCPRIRCSGLGPSRGDEWPTPMLLPCLLLRSTPHIHLSLLRTELCVLHGGEVRGRGGNCQDEGGESPMPGWVCTTVVSKLGGPLCVPLVPHRQSCCCTGHTLLWSGCGQSRLISSSSCFLPSSWVGPLFPVGLGCPLPFYLLSASMEDSFTSLVLDGPPQPPSAWGVLNECAPQEL